MPGIENRIGAVWLGKQSAKGTPALDAALKQGRWVGGDFNMARADGQSQYLDGERFSNAADFIDTITGTGSPVFHGQAGFVGLLAYLFLGQETVTTKTTAAGVEAVYEHVATPSSSGAFWVTAKKKVGQAVGPLRQRFTDYRPSALRLEASSAAKVMQATFPGTAVGEVGDTWGPTDPTAPLATDEPLLFTEAAGKIKLDVGDGDLAVFRGTSAMAVQLNDSLTPWYGDDVTPYEVIFGLGNIVIEALTILVDEAGLEVFNYLMYGSKNPPPGTPARRVLPPFGAYEFDASRGSTFTLTGAGPYVITYRGETAASLPAASTAAAVTAALEDLDNVEPGDVDVSGSASPYTIQFARDVVPLAELSATGGVVADLGPVKQVKVELPNIKLNPDVAIAANPEGGATELPLGAEARRVAPDPHVRITTRSSEPAFT